MILTCVHIAVKPEFLKEFIEATRKNHQETLKETGNIRFDFLQQENDPYHFLLYEAFDSEDAVTQHKTTDHYLQWRDAVQNWMESPRQGIRYKVIEPQDADLW